MTGVVLYQGPSVLDGREIVVIATTSSKNPKTANMIQTWIMRADVEPHTAVKAGLDGSVCGNCPQRHSIGGACYVMPFQAPLQTYRKWKRGGYAHVDEVGHGFVKGRMVRLGSYGDPAAVPFEVWERLLKFADGHTGYTHQLRHPKFDMRILNVCMVSSETPRQAGTHQSHGRRTFRVKTPDAPLLDGEILCPSESQGKSCMECGLCSGAKADGPSIAITAHGSRAGRYIRKFDKANLIAVA